LIKTISKLGRFSIAQVEYFADTVKAACDEQDDQYAPLFDLMNAEALARAYIQHGNYNKAQRVLQPKLDQINCMPHVGPLHQVLCLKTLAHLYEVICDFDGWAHYIHKAHQLSTEAGLEHQRQSIEASIQKHRSRHSTTTAILP
jgi:hypothetical protein